MHLGFLTNCLYHSTLPEIINWAGAHRFRALELACWLPGGNAADVTLDVTNFDQAQADALNALARQHHIVFSCLTYCPNTLSRDLVEREAIIAHLYRILDAAHLLGVNTISTFIGRDETKTQAQNFDDMTRAFAPLLDYAGERGIRIAIENCPMPGWQFEGLPGNLAYAPAIWDEMFARLPHPNFGLNLDPSHLVWLDVNYYEVVPRYASRIFHAHAKDTEIYPDKRAYQSIINHSHRSWWEYRLPGRGEVDWKRWVDVLRANGYEGPLSIEHEDSAYAGSEDRIKEGLLLARRTLEAASGSGE
jgi:sugar phosphate isomerase/epimerase